MISISFENLTQDQQTLVQDAYGTREYSCAGCAVYLGQTPAGEHTYFWHYGSSDGYVALPHRDDTPYYDYSSGNITVCGHEYTTDGEEVLPAPY